MEFLILRLEAPLISFGAPVVDHHGYIQPYPAKSMITGLLANALGYHHGEHDRLERLQERIMYGSREDRPGVQIQDYQTVDLSKPYLSDDLAWTTFGEIEQRKGASGKETHIRLRDYWSDSIHTVVLTLSNPEETPNIDDLARAVKYPERPLFIGRKTCIPSGPICIGKIEAESVREALVKAKSVRKSDEQGKTVRAWWPADGNREGSALNIRPVTDERDWANQIHVGERKIMAGEIVIEAMDNDD